jgi:tetratricopeptide (TPR) repeat protein/predicted Ser/Thr protein kinase
MTLLCPICGEDVPAAVVAGAQATCPRCHSTFAADEATTVGPEITPDGPTRTLAEGERPGAPGAPGAASLPEIPGYRVLGFIARGGMGIVLKAHHAALNRLVAIKVPLARRLATEQDKDRFLREARAAARLRHPHICPIYEVGESRGVPYIAMGFIEGMTLQAWARQHKPTAHRSAKIMATLSRAVGYAHAHNVVHRDIKPANVMIDAETEEPVLMDFGLAKELAEENVQMTRAGQVMGTPAYMAPEQAAGRIDQIGPCTDVYTLGAVLYDLLCGRPPFLGTFGEIVHRLQHDEPVPPRRLAPRVHRDLETICLKALSKDPAGRYASAVALAEDLERFCAGENVLARRAGPAARLWKRVRRRPAASAAIAVAVLLAATAVILVRQADRARSVKSLTLAIQSGLEAEDWSAGRLADMEKVVEDLGRLSPEDGRAARLHLNERFAESLRKAIAQPRITKEEKARIEASLDLLAARDASSAPALRQALQERARAWDTVFELAPPFAGVGEVFPPSAVQVDEKGLLPPKGRTGRDGSTVPTRIPAGGNVQLEAVFARDWENSDEIGLVLNGNPEKEDFRTLSGYTFRLKSLKPPDVAPDSWFSLAMARQSGGMITLQILRNGSLLRELQIAAALVPEGPLRLVAIREGDVLTFQVNDLPPMVFCDTFPLAARGLTVFAVRWPTGRYLERLRGLRQDLPPVASLLERGDDLYAQQKLVEALAAYQQQALTATVAEVGQEARYKQGLCLLGLKRDREALDAFARLQKEDGDRWPPMAAGQLWALYLKQNRADDAEGLYNTLAARYSIDHLAMLIPEDVRAFILEKYRSSGRGWSLIQHNPNRVRDLERCMAVEQFLDPNSRDAAQTKYFLLRAYRMEGENDRAAAFARKALDSAQPISEVSLNNEFCWIQRLRGRPEIALAELDRRLFDAQHNLVPRIQGLLVERARIHAAMKQWDDAEKDIEDYLRLVDDKARLTGDKSVPEACLLAGFLRQQRGDQKGALEAWRRGLPPVREGESVDLAIYADKTGRVILYPLILASLADQPVSSPEAILGTFVPLLKALPGGQASEKKGGSFYKEMMGELMHITPAMLKNMWRSRRGQQYARHMAFLDIPLAESVRVPPVLMATEIIRDKAFPDGTTPEQETILEEAGDRMYGAYFDGRMNLFQGFQFAMALKGNLTEFGWGGVAPTLDAATRGPTAYVLGFVYLRLERPDDAAKLFQTAVTDAPPDSPLRRIAQDELDRLQKK